MSLEKLIRSRWENSSHGYSEVVDSELLTAEKEYWMDFLLESLPEDKNIKILDIGCGPGFFATLLGEKGYKVTGIDVSINMVKEAQIKTQNLGIEADFKVMDCHNLEFEDEHFDIIICRNVVWTLYDPEKAYKEWERCLKSKGKMLVFDANWMLANFDQELRKQKENDEAEYQKLYGELENSCTKKELNDSLDQKAVLARVLRPDWDEKVLSGLGLKVESDPMVYKKLWGKKRKLRYSTSPLFLVRAYKE